MVIYRYTTLYETKYFTKLSLWPLRGNGPLQLGPLCFSTFFTLPWLIYEGVISGSIRKSLLFPRYCLCSTRFLARTRLYDYFSIFHPQVVLKRSKEETYSINSWRRLSHPIGPRRSNLLLRVTIRFRRGLSGGCWGLSFLAFDKLVAIIVRFCLRARSEEVVGCTSGKGCYSYKPVII